MSYRIFNLINYGEVKVYWLNFFEKMVTIGITYNGKIRCSDPILRDIVVRHEVLHLIQADEIGWWLGYYFWLWLGHGYKNHPFEKDANEYDNDINFVANRPYNNWKKYA